MHESDVPPVTDAARRRRRSASTRGSRRRTSGSSDARGARGLALGAFERTPPPFRLAAFVGARLRRCRSSSARGTSSATASSRSLYVMLGLGLNVVVGFAGLLDLGYVAFYGIGAYTYALLSSTCTGSTGRPR